MLTGVDVSVSSHVKIKLAIAGSGNEIYVKIQFKDILTVKNAVFQILSYITKHLYFINFILF